MLFAFKGPCASEWAHTVWRGRRVSVECIRVRADFAKDINRLNSWVGSGNDQSAFRMNN